MSASLATWNPARSVWETTQGMFCGHLELYSETWPSSGSMRNGQVFERPTSAPPTADSASSSSPGLLRTPAAAEAEGGPRDRNRPGATMRLSDQIREEMDDGPDQRLTCATCGEPVEPTRADVFNGTWCDCPVKLFSTPDTVPEAPNTGSNSHKAGNVVGLGNQVMSLLPTPEAKLASSGPDYARMNREGSGGDDLITTLWREGMHLLPTPQAADGTGGRIDREGIGGKRVSGAKRSITLASVAHHHLMPTPRASRGGSSTETMYGLGAERVDDERPQGQVVADVTDWGPYEAAIRRWEAIIGRPAPAPVRFDGKGGKPRLNPELTEWMMGWPAGHVTDPAIGLTRAEQLKACGNGVVPQQAAAALREMLARPGVPPIRYALAA